MVSILLIDMHYFIKTINRLLKKAPMKDYLTPINKIYNDLLEPIINVKFYDIQHILVLNEQLNHN